MAIEAGKVILFQLCRQRLPLRFELVRRAEFDHYVMRNAEPIPAEIRYLRLVLKAPVPNQSWSNQIAGIEIER